MRDELVALKNAGSNHRVTEDTEKNESQEKWLSPFSRHAFALSPFCFLRALRDSVVRFFGLVLLRTKAISLSHGSWLAHGTRLRIMTV
jgi:hypothetical protein